MRAQPPASHFIDGKPFEDASGAVLESRYPATDEVIARLHCATDRVIAAAVESAARAQADWAARPAEERGAILCRAAAILKERNRELSELETLDTGKAIQETLVADAASGADCLDFMGRTVPSYTGRQIDLGGPHAYTRPEPFGVNPARLTELIPCQACDTFYSGPTMSVPYGDMGHFPNGITRSNGC